MSELSTRNPSTQNLFANYATTGLPGRAAGAGSNRGGIDNLGLKVSYSNKTDDG